MINKDVLNQPEIIENGGFDYQEDAQDTISYLAFLESNLLNLSERARIRILKEQLTKQYEAYLENLKKMV